MTKVLVLGSKGMLGAYMYRYLTQSGLDVTPISRDTFDAGNDDISKLTIQNYDVVVNCIGTIRPTKSVSGTLEAIKINAVFPNLLSLECERWRKRLIHITTDCVFSGEKGNYVESDEHDATDVYGKSKSLGEPNIATIIRTSIIGEELHTTRSLVEWVRNNSGKTVNGYVNHTWNGVTCLQLAKYVEDMIEKNTYWIGNRHIFSPNDVTKFELVNLISDKFNFNVDVVPYETTPAVYKTLRSEYSHTGLIIPHLDEQVSELVGYLRVIL